MPNRLAAESSPYLLQHQNNPVDWYPWGEEAFARAREEDKPIFLSVGYSSCHWCHVMEHESFEDEETARLMNETYVCVKVDREERPDVDETYMTAVQLSAGRGGWPMSVFMTADKRPFFAGTYFPKEERGGHPSFAQILQQVGAVWSQERHKVYEIANQYADAITQSRSQTVEASTLLGPVLLADCVRAHSTDFDEENGGFGQSPKFPPHTALEFLMTYAIGELGEEDVRQTAADMALFTLEKMALGGFHDHVGGGFHRYSTDERWLLPHFEKMLYDNALLLGNYSRAASLCHEQLPELERLYSQAADGIVRWLKSEMTSPEGLFYSAQDADSEGEEGKFYVWRPEEVDAILGEESRAFQDAFQFHPDGNFRDESTGHITGANIPHLLEFTGDRFEMALSKLRTARASRVRPGLDDKALVGWNGLMISALAEAGEISMAEGAMEAILMAEKPHGRLPHQITKGVPSGDAFLEDYAYFIDSLISLTGVKNLFVQVDAPMSGRAPFQIFEEAQRLGAEMVEKFYDKENGGFFGTSLEHEELFGRTKPIFDQPTPSANAIAAKVLIDLEDEARAMKTVQSMLGWMERAPSATEALHLVVMALLIQREEEEAIAPIVSQPVEVKLVESRLKAVSGKAIGEVVISIPAGLHINSAKPPARWLIPTEVQIQPLKFSVDYPEPVNDQYTGEVHMPFTVELPSGSRGEEFELTVRFQPCTDSECHLLVEKRFSGVVEPT